MLSGKQIAEARKRKGLTQEALAAELGVSRQTIAKWEQEISTPSVTNAHRLIDILGLQEMENKSSTEDEGNARTICKKRLTKRLLIELWAVYVGIAFLCFFSIGIVALFFIPAISVVLILVAIVVQEVRGKKTDSPMKILLGGICFIGLAILAVVAILASGFVLRENYQHKAFYSVPATQLKKYSAINEWIDECKTIGPDIYGQCIELPSDKTICLYIVYRHQVTDASDASLVSDPLHMRFIAKYRGGTEYDGVDLYFLQGRSSYQMLFSIDGSEPYYNSMATVNPMLIDDVKALFNNLQGDEKMLKKVKKIVALMMATMALSTLFVTTAFAQENDVEVIEEAKILEEIVSYLEDGVTIDVAPNESKRIEIPLSNGESAYLEIGCTPITLTRGTTSASYNYTSNGDYIFWGDINYGSIGSYSHRVNFKITALSPTCEFYITSASVEYQQPSVGYVNSGSGITGNKNYDVKTSSYSKAYASFTINGHVNNIYSKILMNSMNPNKITFTIYYSLAPID